MESVRLKINEHMASVGEEILCVLDKQQLELHVRVFVLERLGATAEFMCSLFQREIETLETLLEKQNELLDIDFDMDIDLHTAGMSGIHITSNYTLQGCLLHIQQTPQCIFPVLKLTVVIELMAGYKFHAVIIIAVC